jgi:nitrite reductase (NO-forming)
MVALFGAACADDKPSTSAVGAGAANASALQPGDSVEFIATEFSFAPMSLMAEPGEYQGTLVNRGAVEHDVAFEGGGTFLARPGETVSVAFTVPPEGLRFWCSIPGHEDAGMAGFVATPTSGAAPAGSHTASASATGVVEPDPGAPAYELRDPAAPARGEGDGITLVSAGAPGGGDLIEVELMVEERLMTVAEGFQQKVWTFNGSVPGPVIRARVGDTVRVHLVNPASASLSHSVDFHASQVAWNDEMRSIEPGQELIYEFTTDYAGVWMYHCGTPPVLHHIANGMFGMVIVEPEEGLPAMENEFFLVQNEWYLGPQGEVSSLAKADQGAPSPDLMMFNGVAMQYRDNPIEIPTGEEVRLFVLNVGPSMDSAFHIVGTIFDTVIKEGVQLVRGNDGNWGSQAVDLAPAQGAIIELQAAEDGLYPIVTHAFNFPGRGALGLLQAGDGEP